VFHFNVNFDFSSLVGGA